MRRKLLLLIGIALPALMWAGKSTPYSTIFYGDDEWTVIDANSDGKTWTKESGSSYSTAYGAAGGIKYPYHSKNSGDDWCISPAITLEAGKEYKLKIWEKTGSYAESYKVFLAQENTIEALTAGTTILNRESIKSSSWAKQVTTFTVETTGDYYLGIYGCSAADQFNLYLTSFFVGENVLTAGQPTGLTATEDPAGALKVDLLWVLPTVDTDGAALAEDAITGVKVYRDDELIGTLDGQATSMTDTEALGLTVGFHNYSVSALIGTAEGAKATIRSRYVGPIPAQALPWTSDFSSADILEAMWKIVKGANSTATENWKYYTSSYYGNGAQFAPGSGKVLDDWLITPPLKFEHAGAYKVVFNSKFNDYSSGINFGVALGKGADISTYNTITTYDKIGSSAADYECMFEITEPGEYNIGFHAGIANSNGSTYYIYSVNVSEITILPAQVADLQAEIVDETIKLTWTNPALNNIGSALTSLTKAEVYRNGTLAETIENPTVGAVQTWTDNTPAAGINKYYIKVFNENGEAEGTPTEVASPWFGDPTQHVPYSFDFASQDLFGLYTAVDANNDDYTWKYNSTYKYAYLDKTSSDYSSANDYLVTPPFALEAGYYKVTYKTSGVNKTTIKNGVVTDINNVAGTFADARTFTEIGYTTTTENVFHIAEAGTYYFAWLCTESFAGSDKNTTVENVQIELIPIVPGVATDLTVVADPNFDLSATLTWTNPTTTNVEGVAATNLTKAVVYRNGEQIAEITEGLVPGETSTYVDTEVPSAGKYTYAVEIYNAEGKADGDAPTVVCDWIGGGLALPYTADYNDWQIWNVNADKNSWEEEITWNKNSDGSRIYIVSNNNTPNDWAISPRLTLVKGMYYDITVKSWTGMDGEPPYTWELAYGTSTDPESMVAITTITTNVKNLVDAQQDVITICVDEPDAVCTLPVVPYGVRTIGIHAINKGAVQIGELTIGESTASVGSINRNGGIRVVGGNIVFDGLAHKMTIVDLSGKIVASANACNTYNISALASGSYIVSAYVDGRHTVCKIIK
ncbi:MAG: hypothetical protein PUE54_10245 [Bacteroidales bacterium]|nr:hypothetical protein [Bacteroidales bacterium]